MNNKARVYKSLLLQTHIISLYLLPLSRNTDAWGFGVFLFISELMLSSQRFGSTLFIRPLVCQVWAASSPKLAQGSPKFLSMADNLSFELASLVAKSLMSGLNKMFLCLRKGSCLLALTSFSPSFTDKRHKPRVIKRVTQAFSASQQPNQDSSPVFPILSSSIHRK